LEKSEEIAPAPRIPHRMVCFSVLEDEVDEKAERAEDDVWNPLATNALGPLWFKAVTPALSCANANEKAKCLIFQ